MAAPNFLRGKTSKIFAVLTNREEIYKECSECGERHYDSDYSEESFKNLICCKDATLEEKTNYIVPDEYEYEDLIAYIRETAQEKIKDLEGFWYREESGSDNDRNYPATKLFSFNATKIFGGIEVIASVTGKIVAALYEGASLDFTVEFNDEEYSDDAEFDFEWLFENDSDMPLGMQVIQNKNATKWAEEKATELIELIEEVFIKVSTPLNVVARFSNGETIYEKA